MNDMSPTERPLLSKAEKNILQLINNGLDRLLNKKNIKGGNWQTKNCRTVIIVNDYYWDSYI